ncbi:hypothetical protein [Limimaricola litoreus]|uniref:Uncharacterized protein n=1 Tax=Limimaricola litoreus TaxID=2955316 RepID=A0A9X2FPR3_9RHOB|nr:hypothetical protein [Limimaricola litoreus]MCP1169387.1 hypothetical protein [Limimaricola litoreus]
MLDEETAAPFPIIRHVVGEGSSYRNASLDADGLHPLQVKYANWTEDYIDPDELRTFPLRELAPGVVEFLAEAGHLSQRDIRYISERLNLADRDEDFDPKDPVFFYDALLDVLEANPWVMPTLEVEVVQNRSGITRGKPGSQKSYRKRLGRTLSKLMLSKLRFKNNEALQKRLPEFVSSEPVPVDLWVGAFCEYAIDHYYRFIEHMPDRIYTMVYEMSLGNVSSRDLLDHAMEESEEDGDWSLAQRLITIQAESAKTHNTPLDEDDFAALRRVLTALVSGLDQETGPDRYHAIANLSSLAAEMAELRDRADIDMIAAVLTKIGMEMSREDLDEETVQLFCQPRILNLLDDLVHAIDELAEDETRSAELDAKIAEATKARRYDQVRSLADEAEIVNSRIARVAEMHTQAESIRDAITARDLATLDILLAELPSVEEDEVDADPAPGDASPSDDEASQADAPADQAAQADASTDRDRDEEPLQESEPAQPQEIEQSPRDISAGEQEDQVAIDDPAEEVQDAEPVDSPAQESPSEASQTSEEQEIDLEDDLEMAALEAATAPDPEEDPYIEPPLPTKVLPELVERGLIGLAADAADALEAHRHRWPIEGAALRAAAASRAPHGDYGPDTQRFLTIANRAATAVKSDNGANMLFGALLRPAILQQSFSLRALLPDLARGSLGPHLKEVGAAIADLDFDFPPSPDTLARLSGAPLAPQRQRIAERLENWISTTARKSSRWGFATAFMHHTVSDAGLIGKAMAAIRGDSSDARHLAQAAIDGLGTGADIEALAIEYAATTSRPSARLHSKGVEYLQRHFDEALGMLSAWLVAVQRDDAGSQRSEDRLRSTVASLHSRLEKARDNLVSLTGLSPLQKAMATWLSEQIAEAIEALNGADTGAYATIEDALMGERDLLPDEARRIANDPEALLAPLIGIFETTGIPTPAEAFDQAVSQGAFEVAHRLATRHDITTAEESLAEQIKEFTKGWIDGLETRQRRMKLLAKVDYDHQEEIARRLSWCESALERLSVVAAGTGLDDLDDIPIYAAELDAVAKEIEANIRRDQKSRIAKYRNEQNGEEADALLDAVEDLTLEAAEDRIAQLRDGRSAATFEAELEGVIADFTPGFVTAASGPDWPRNMAGFEKALAEDGLLFTDESRRPAAIEFLGLYRELCAAIPKGKPSAARIRAFFEEIGFENVRINGITGLGRTKSWRMNMLGDLQSGDLSSSGWFLPPIFGSKAVSGYAVFLIGPDTLPETVHKALDAEIPTILVLSGVADMTKRRDFAERLRATAVPAVLIDEALVAFAATRRETRARTIFECGLPYGRVEPYITDAGQLPPEMFFGREAEIRSIMEKSSQGCLVYGGRQLGKSALLNHIAHTRHSPEENRIVVRHDVKMLGKADDTSKIWDYLKQMLSPEGVVREASRDPDAITQDIRAWLHARPGSQIVCLFDETDNFMDAETKADYPQLSRLKALMEDTGRSFKVVFAGLHNVRRMHRQPNSPLAHLGQGNCIGPLNQSEDDKRAAHDLIIAPMRAAGFKFESIEAVEEILAWANYYPSLVQEYARGLLSTLHGAGSGKTYRLPDDGPLWTIPTSKLFAHRGFSKIESRIREKFHYTLDLDSRYALVAYTLGWLNAEGFEHQALVSGFRAAELLEHASAFWPKNAERPSQAAFDALLDELFDLGVLGRVPIPGTNLFTYCLRTRQVAAMLGSREDIETALLQIQEKDPTVSYDRTIHRRRYAAPGKSISAADLELPYAPITDFQIERLLDPDGAPAQIVCGLDVLGLKKVGMALKRIAAVSQLPGLGRNDAEILVTEDRRDIRPILDKVRKSDNRPRIIVHTPTSAAQANEELGWLERQPAVLDGQVRPILLLDASDPEMRALANRREQQTEFLAPWGAEMLRVHLSNIDHTELDTPDLRTKILSATGGIPGDTVKLVAELARPRGTIADTFESWSANIRVPDAIARGAIGKALALIEDTKDPGDYEALNDIIREETGADLVTHGPDLLATGLITTWNPKTKRIRRSDFGELIASRLGGKV